MSASDKTFLENYWSLDAANNRVFSTASAFGTSQIVNFGGGLMLNTWRSSPNATEAPYDIYLGFKDIDAGYIYGYTYYEDSKYKFQFNGRFTADTGSLSDDRLKHNETTIDNALDTVMKLEAKRYLKTIQMYDASYTLIKDNSGNYTNLKDHDSVSEEIGFIAQDLLEIEELSFIVDCDSSVNETKPYSVSYNNIFVVGIQAIQELNVSLNTEKEKVIALESKIEAQETLINSLLERVTALENNE